MSSSYRLGWSVLMVGSLVSLACGGKSDGGTGDPDDSSSSAGGSVSSSGGGLSAGGATGAGGRTASSGGSVSTSGGGSSAGGSVSSSGGGSSSGGSVSSSGGGSSAGGATGAGGRLTTECTSLDASASPAAEVIRVPLDTPPPYLGGTLTEGTYYATSVTVYGSNELCDLLATQISGSRFVIEVQPSSPSGGALEAAIDFAEQASEGAFDYSIDGTVLTTTPACGGSMLSSSSFTATATTLTMAGSTSPSVDTVCPVEWMFELE